MMGSLAVIAAVTIVAKAADMNNRSAFTWGLLTFLLYFAFCLVIGFWFAGLAVTVVMLAAMFIANIINDPTKAKADPPERRY